MKIKEQGETSFVQYFKFLAHKRDQLDNWSVNRFLLIFALPDHYLIMGRHHLVGVTVPTGTASWSGVYSKRFRTQPDVTRGKEALNQDKVKITSLGDWLV